MLCEKILGNLNDGKFDGKNVDYVDIEWHEAFKKIHRKTSGNGTDVAVRLDDGILLKGLRQGDVLGESDGCVIAVNVPECDVLLIKVDVHHPHMREKVCYEVGNRHATLFWGEGENEFVTPVNDNAMMAMLEGLHGVTVKRDRRKLDFDRGLSSTVHSHSH